LNFHGFEDGDAIDAIFEPSPQVRADEFIETQLTDQLLY
jgi:hypothetical protein